MIVNKNLCNILKLLTEGELTVTTISNNLKLSQPLTSSRLKMLKKLKLVTQRREKSKIFYKINEEKRAKILGLLDFINCL